MFTNCRRLVAALSVLFSAPYVLAASSKAPTTTLTPYDFCYEGEGAICGIMRNLRDSCKDVDVDKFYDCQCKSGYVEANEACQYCLAGTGQMYDERFGSRDFDRCKEESISVGPIPASYISDIKDRNKTVAMPKITSTWSNTYDNSKYSTESHNAITSTIYGVASVTLPSLIPPTTTADSAGSTLGVGSGLSQRHLLVAALVACVVVFAF